MSDSCVATPELAEEPAEQRVVALVVDEEAGVEREAVVHDRVRVPARAARRARTRATSCARASTYAAPEPEMPLPTTAIRINRYSPAANTG